MSAYYFYHKDMSFVVVGLGNPGEEYVNTRHNVGRMVVEAFRKSCEGTDWEKDKKLQALVSEAKLKKEKVLMVEPETYMNKSGASIKPLITSVKKAEQLILVQDEIDLPIGRIKISFNRSAGGHKGVNSVMKAIGTEAFTRVRVGISPANAKGVVKKPKSEDEMNDFIVGPFKPKEWDEMKKAVKDAAKAVQLIIEEGRDRAMMEFNSK